MTAVDGRTVKRVLMAAKVVVVLPVLGLVLLPDKPVHFKDPNFWAQGRVVCRFYLGSGFRFYGFCRRPCQSRNAM